MVEMRIERSQVLDARYLTPSSLPKGEGRRSRNASSSIFTNA